MTVVTYPFFFGMMFGDMGHGSLYLALGLGLTLGYNSLKDGPMAGVLPLRYLFLFMGFFATYCGFIYNEWFAIATNMFGSCYAINDAVPLDPPGQPGT